MHFKAKMQTVSKMWSMPRSAVILPPGTRYYKNKFTFFSTGASSIIWEVDMGTHIA